MKLYKLLNSRNKKIDKNSKKRGFTLVEMIIVVTILGILASIAIIKYGKVEENAKKNIDYTNASNIASAATIAMSEGMPSEQVTVKNLVEKGYLNNEPVPQSTEGEFTIDINSKDKNIVVKVGNAEMYPKSQNKIK
ncbi:type II secretion system protein [Peptacetobacter sp.]|uniref:type II secretion system protein n=1 Tax=Peptacetobacter sp. TaxID=2991975 RepID=UPI00260F3E0D|nr:prepilin-type N-terminal cleavage/methylation domain-containing protein [Peptacetobacter sp.]